jgi:acyl carrier protein
LPQTLSGKLDRRALPGLAAAKDLPEGQEPNPGLEMEIAGMYAELLCVPAVSRLDDFTLLGGDSLRIARVLDELRARYGVDVPVQAFAGDPTVAGLANAVATALASRDSPLGEDR